MKLQGDIIYLWKHGTSLFCPLYICVPVGWMHLHFSRFYGGWVHFFLAASDKIIHQMYITWNNFHRRLTLSENHSVNQMVSLTFVLIKMTEQWAEHMKQSCSHVILWKINNAVQRWCELFFNEISVQCSVVYCYDNAGPRRKRIGKLQTLCTHRHKRMDFWTRFTSQ